MPTSGIGFLESNPMNPVDINDFSEKNCECRKQHRASEQSQLDGFTGKRRFVLMIMVDPDEKCREFIDLCSTECSSEVKEACQQQISTLHFTLFANKLLDCNEASSISFMNGQGMKVDIDQVAKYGSKSASTDLSDANTLPSFNLTGLLNWPKTIALATDTKVDKVADSIEAPFQWKVQKSLHLSLYRMHGFSEKKLKQFQRIHDCVRMINGRGDFDYGTAKGTKIVLKEQGARYDGSDGRFYRIVYEE